jgi:hypothetical protein
LELGERTRKWQICAGQNEGRHGSIWFPSPLYLLSLGVNRISTVQRTGKLFRGVNLGFTQDGLTQLISAHRPKLDSALKRAPIIRTRSRLCTIHPKRIGCGNSTPNGLTASC